MDPFGVFIEVYNLFTSPKPPYKVGKSDLEHSRALMTLSRSFWKRLGPSGAVWRARGPSGGFRARARARVCVRLARARLRACSRAFPAARDSSGTFERLPDASPRAPCAPCPLPARASVARASDWPCARVHAARAHLPCASACLPAALARARAHVMTGPRAPISCTLACHRLGVILLLFLGSLDCLGLGWLLLGNAKEP